MFCESNLKPLAAQIWPQSKVPAQKSACSIKQTAYIFLLKIGGHLRSPTVHIKLSGDPNRNGGRGWVGGETNPFA